MLLSFYWKTIFKYDTDHILFIKRNSNRIRMETIIIQIIGLCPLFLFFIIGRENIIPAVITAFISVINSIMVLTIMSKNEKKFIKYTEEQKILNIKKEIEKEIIEMSLAMMQSGKFTDKEIEWKMIHYQRKVEECRELLHFMAVHNSIKEFIKNVRLNRTEENQKIHDTSLKTVNLEQKYLSVLGLPPGTNDIKKIKKKYFELMKNYHPDINKTKEAEAKTKELNEAYNQLKILIRQQ